MSKTYEELIDKSFELRKKDSFEESLLAARSALALDSESADAWWLIAINNESLEKYDLALKAFKTSLNIYPDNAYRWSRYGKALKKSGQDDTAINAFETALKANSIQKEALTEIVTYYCWDGKYQNEVLGFKYLKALDDNYGLTTDSYINQLGRYYYAKNLYLDALRCFRKCSKYKNFEHGLFNTGLSYLAIGQKLNALDTWYEGIKYYPDNEVQKKEFLKAMESFRQQKSKIRRTTEILEEKDWYEEYLNPFELLGIDDSIDLDEIDAKIIQNHRKLLLQEIELEEGKISWLNGKVIDKSRAIGLIDSLNDENIKNYHAIIYKNKFISKFLSKGDVGLFLMEPCDEIENFVDALNFDPEGFSEWFSAIFAKQFDIIFKIILKSNDGDLYTLLLSGRLWVNDSHLNDLFAGSHYEVDKLLEGLRSANKRSKTVKISYNTILLIINEDKLFIRLSPLPAQFIGLQEEAVGLIRGIAINAMNVHRDSAASKELLELAKTFIPKGSKMSFDLMEDSEAINDIIESEKKDESALTIGKINTSIKKEGVRHGSQFIPADKVEALFWGYLITSAQYTKTYDYRFQFVGNGTTINVNWSGSEEGDKSKVLYDKHVNALLTYIFPSTIDYVKNQLKRGEIIMIGACRVTKENIQFETKGWFSKKSHVVPWSRVKVELSNGDLILCSSDNYSDKVNMPLMSTPNSFILYSLVKNY
jgi:tetratricopeptide (TPR) repeat protein